MDERTTIVLDGEAESIVQDRLSSGEYRSAEEVVREGLSLLRERDERIEAIRAALIEGEESGPSEPFDPDEFLAEMRGKHSAP